MLGKFFDLNLFYIPFYSYCPFGSLSFSVRTVLTCAAMLADYVGANLERLDSVGGGGGDYKKSLPRLLVSLGILYQLALAFL